MVVETLGHAHDRFRLRAELAVTERDTPRRPTPAERDGERVVVGSPTAPHVGGEPPHGGQRDVDRRGRRTLVVDERRPLAGDLIGEPLTLTPGVARRAVCAACGR